MQKNALYYKNNYLIAFDAIVEECINDGEKIKIVLNETAFYPEGGGQPADIGEMSGIKVIHVEEKNETIYHIVEKEIEVGTKVHCVIDFEKRFANMQNHSGEHIVSGLICSMFGADNVGFHMGKDYVTMDFNTSISEEQLREIEIKANKAIYKNIDIETKILSKEEAEKIEFRSKKELKGDIRLVKIQGFDICACCGIHVTKTGEIGIIKLLSLEKYKTGVRIYMLTGKRAIENYTNMYSQIDNISTMLSVKNTEVYQAVNELKEELENLKREKTRLNNEIFDYKINAIQSSKNLVFIEEDLTSGDMKNLCEKLKKKAEKIAAVFSENTNGYSFMIVSDNVNLQKLSSELREKFAAKCGGKSNAISGQFTGDIKEIETFINNYEE